jgi:hypothetical protein
MFKPRITRGQAYPGVKARLLYAALTLRNRPGTRYVVAVGLPWSSRSSPGLPGSWPPSRAQRPSEAVRREGLDFS